MNNDDLLPPLPFKIKYKTVFVWVPGSDWNLSQAFLLRNERHSLFITHLHEQGFQECDMQKVSNLLTSDRWNVARVNSTPIISASWRSSWFFQKKTHPFGKWRCIQTSIDKREMCKEYIHAWVNQVMLSMYVWEKDALESKMENVGCKYVFWNS